MTSFVNALQASNDYTQTENGATALSSTGNALVDLFGVIGALRSRTDAEILELFSKAFSVDRLLATKMVFYARNIRGGLGEKRTPRILWKQLALANPEILIKNIQFVPLFGRWDDLYSLIDTPVEEAAWQFMRDQLAHDLKGYSDGNGISIMAKWLHSDDTSSKEACRLGRRTARRLGLTLKEYQSTLRKLRKYLDVVEVKMTAQDWDKIVYSATPSRAMMIYRKAFSRHDGERFGEFINKVASGEEKINASTLFPYDIMEGMGLSVNRNRSGFLQLTEPDRLLQEQWKALPNYVIGDGNILVMSDTSQSMEGRPMATAVGLAIYFAERNTGVFKDMFMTFSESPSFVTLKGDTLTEKVACIPSIVSNTDLELAFQLVLATAIEHSVPAEDMPKSIVVISDMEIDACVESDSPYETFYIQLRRMFAEKGYEIPNIVFWNVNSTKDTFHVRANMPGVQLASGQSPSVFKSVIANIGKTGYESMVATLSDEMYDCITI
jgi:hypothetical protein